MGEIEFRTGVIKPLECFKEGWELIKPDYWLIFCVTLVGLLISSLIPLALGMGAMYCGIYYCIFKLMRGRRPEFNDLFKGFSHFLPALIATAILLVPMAVFTIVSSASMFGILLGMTDASGNLDPSALFALYGVLITEGLVFGIVGGCIHAFVIFTYPLIVEHGLSGIEAFKLSSKAAWANLSGVVGLIVWQFVLGFIGFLCCVVGLYLVMPVLFAGVLVAYRRVFPSVPVNEFK